MEFLYATNNSPAEGTGIKILIEQSQNFLGPNIPPSLLKYTLDRQISLFGDYPNESDFIPSLTFSAIFAVFLIAHSFVFFVNLSRGHYFYISIGWMFYSTTRILGFALRAVWAKDITSATIGIASEIFLVLSSMFLVSFNLILAQRIFTWRHPVGGSRMLFWNTMFSLYGIVLGMVAMAIVSSSIPSIYFLSERSYSICKRVVEASAILIDLYSLTSFSLLSLAYFFKPTRKDENTYTYQPWWIKSFGILYYVQPGAAKDAAETFLKRNHYSRRPKRVIAATNHYHNYALVQGVTTERGGLSHNYSLMILCVSTILIFVGSLCRSVAILQGRIVMEAGPICKPIVMYICFGGLEVIINILYLIGRVDLRFYRPDRLPKRIRDIITAEQSRINSESNSDYEFSEDETERNTEARSSITRKSNEKQESPVDSEFHF